MSQTVASGVLTIDGRSFHVLGIEPSANEHVAFAEKVTGECGLHGLIPFSGETEREYIVRSYKTAVLSGRPLFNFLGTILLPAELTPKDWTPGLALQTGEFFATRTAMPDKIMLQSVLKHLFLIFGGKFYHAHASLSAPGGSLRWVN